MSAKFRVKKESIDRTRKELQAFKSRKKKHFELALAMWGDGTVAEVQGLLQQVGAFDQGLLSAATERTEPIWNGVKLRIVVFNPLEYALVVEFGRRGGSGKPPPLLALVGWASRKGIVKLPRNISFGGQWAEKWAASGAVVRNMKKKGGKSSSGPKKPMDPVIRDLLIIRLIAKKIYEKGTKGRHPFTIAFQRRLKVLRKEVSATMSLLK